MQVLVNAVGNWLLESVVSCSSCLVPRLRMQTSWTVSQAVVGLFVYDWRWRHWESSELVSWEFNVPFQHKYGYIRDERVFRAKHDEVIEIEVQWITVMEIVVIW